MTASKTNKYGCQNHTQLLGACKGYIREQNVSHWKHIAAGGGGGGQRVSGKLSRDACT